MANPEYHHLYRTKQWRGLREVKLSRNPLCERCLSEKRVTEATLVHHRRPHRGDRGLFLAWDNLASSCRPCHDVVEQGIEKRGYDKTIGGDGWPVDDNHPANRT